MRAEMNVSRVWTQRLVTLAAATTLALGLAALGATPVAADCDGPVPSFRAYAGSADRIVIGDVIAVDPTAPWTDDQGRSSRFTLRVRYVLRGHADAVMTLRDLAFLPCADHIIIAREGDRIALALGATGFEPKITFDTVAWIRGTPPNFFDSIERITVAEVFSLVGKTAPDTSTTALPDEPSPIGGIAVLLAGFVGGVIGWRRGVPTRS
jgi:hypothetical protein